MPADPSLQAALNWEQQKKMAAAVVSHVWDDLSTPETEYILIFIHKNVNLFMTKPERDQTEGRTCVQKY